MNDIHNRPIAQRIDWLFDLARRHGETFRGPEAWLARERYLAEHPTIGKKVALKVLRMRGIADESFRRRFFLEASLTSQISHRNLVTIYDYGRIEDDDEPQDESYFLAMELLRGETLAESLARRGAMDGATALALFKL